MKKHLYIILSAAGIFLSGRIAAQQDPLVSQYMFNPLYINPAYAGSRGVMNGDILLRKQWVGFPGAPTTEVFAVNAPTRKGKVGLGLEVIGDQIGPKRNSGLYFDYAYRLPLGKGKLAFGLGAGIMNYRVNWNEIEYKDAQDPYASLGATNITKPDFKGGIYFNNKRFYIGASITHMNQEAYVLIKDSLTLKANMSQHTFFTMGRAFQLGDNITFCPSILVRYTARNGPGSNTSTGDLNLNFRYKELMWAGISFRGDKELVFMAQYNLNSKWKLGYSYDMSLGPLKTYESGSHEIVLAFDLNVFQSQILSPRFF
ncbi:MAG TPA: type IX secretion system membrane protein PorP/SprF [Bacteroidia bacterium]|nr:type IX secretion system membrane protein PorP/SprF [Bacteroidia bacterium]